MKRELKSEFVLTDAQRFKRFLSELFNIDDVQRRRKQRGRSFRKRSRVARAGISVQQVVSPSSPR